jgi:hypothetical protein
MPRIRDKVAPCYYQRAWKMKRHCGARRHAASAGSVRGARAL